MNRLATVFLGDSITQADTPSFDAEPGEGSWVRHVLADPRCPWQYAANVAVAGETLADLAARFDRDVLARSPDAVVVMGGTNDAWTGVPLEISFAALRGVLDAADRAGLETWVVAPPPVDWSTGFAAAMPGLVDAQRSLCREREVTFLEASSTVATTDGVHPTVGGARTIAAAVLAQLD